MQPQRDSQSLEHRVISAIDATPVVDMHTHLYSPSFMRTPEPGSDQLVLWGIDALLDYHYFTDELFRVLEPGSLTPEAYWAMPMRERADLAWQKLFVERPAVSESCVGLIEILTSFGLDPHEPDLRGYRSWFAGRELNEHIDDVMRLANVKRIVMTNEPFSEVERPRWLENGDPTADSRFSPVLRVDPIVEQWRTACRSLQDWGYAVGDATTDTAEVRRFLNDWIVRMRPEYLACSLSPSFRYEELDGSLPGAAHADHRRRVFDECFVPCAREHGLPLALMIGAKRAVHPEMRLAGDGLGRADTDQLIAVAHRHTDVTFLCTMLSRENQHELCVAARKFSNIVPFGCWWYLNTTSQIVEMTRMRLEALGTSFVPQHSDARVLEQLIYKWKFARELIARCLTERYEAAERSGAVVSDEQIAGDAARLLDQNYSSRAHSWD